MIKKTLLVLMGGKNAEHEVSLQSAKNILKNLSNKKYTIIPVGISKTGSWQLLEGEKVDNYFQNPDNPKTITLQESVSPCKLENIDSECHLITLSDKRKIDIVFPVLHGTNAEDGRLQGFLEMLDVPYVGCDSLSSAICYDKAVTKAILRDKGISVAPGEVYDITQPLPKMADLKAKYNTPLFVKPAKSGSSVGVHKVSNQKELAEAVTDAARHDNKILLEQAIQGKELECAIKGNSSDSKNPPAASVIGEVLVTGEHEFYDYNAKYLDEHGSEIVIPANITSKQTKDLQEQALKAYRTLGCSGLARVDMFLTDSGEIYINEINTFPGFTNISMYPKLWEASGTSYVDLLDELITLSIERKRL